MVGTMVRNVLGERSGGVGARFRISGTTTQVRCVARGYATQVFFASCLSGSEPLREAFVGSWLLAMGPGLLQETCRLCQAERIDARGELNVNLRS